MPTTRRQFFRSAVATAAVALPGLAAAAGDRAPVNQVRPTDVNGLVPAEHVVGPVVVRFEHDYLVFDAHQTDEFGRVVDSGLAVVRLDDCAGWKIRMPGDEHLAAHPVGHAGLDTQETYQVVGSTWAKQLDADGAGLRHLIFTFAETNFECVAGTVRGKLFHEPFAEVYELLASL